MDKQTKIKVDSLFDALGFVARASAITGIKLNRSDNELREAIVDYVHYVSYEQGKKEGSKLTNGPVNHD